MRTWLSAVVALSLLYSVATTLMFGYFFISAMKPACRASVVEMPGLTLSTATSPLSCASLAIVSAAAAPPCALLEVIAAVSRLVSLIVVSTAITGMPALTNFWIGALSALTSVGAISSALGCLASSELTTGSWVVGLNVVPPCQVSFTPSFFASAAAPACMVM